MNENGEVSSNTAETLTEQTSAWLKDRLAAIYTPEGVQRFWSNANTFLDNKSPAEMISIDPQRVILIVEALES